MTTDLFHLGFDWALFFPTFALIFVAELPDKTALAVVILASRNHPWAVFYGAAGAFLVQNLVAVLFGSLFGLISPHVIHVLSGLLFLLFAVLMWVREQEAKKAASQKGADFLKTVGASFMVIFIAEWGDLTQLASATLVAKTHQPLVIFVSSTLALWATTLLAILLGHYTKKAIDPKPLQRIAAVVFALVGILLLSGFWDK